MKGFIKLKLNYGNDDFMYFPVDKIGVRVTKEGVIILFDGDAWRVKETIEEITAKIKALDSCKTKSYDTRMELLPTLERMKNMEEALNTLKTYSILPEAFGSEEDFIKLRQNFYYHSSDRLPIKEDTDNDGCVYVSNFLQSWRSAAYNVAGNFKYWAPVPKVEVRL